jgi:hypothetical protein
VGGFALLLLMLSGAAKLEPADPTADSDLQPYHNIQVVSIDGACSQELDAVVTLPSATLLAFAFPPEYLPQGSHPIIRLTLSGSSIETFSISFALAPWELMNSRFPHLGPALLVAQDFTPPGEFDARLQIAWGKGALCRNSEVTFRVATITGNPAYIPTIRTTEDLSAGGSLRSGGGSAAEGGARPGCALQAQAPTAAPSGVWFFLCSVSLGILLISLRVRSSPAGTLES